MILRDRRRPSVEAVGTKRGIMNLKAMVQIDVLEKPIERIKETCVMMGITEKFERALPELETFLEGEVAKGETRETRLTYDGLCYLKQVFSRK
ncbi:hypothetical protein [Bradyrhizobium sp. Leo170]|uniref:hypothetical protein n=1 Tax=Bradyrhizobium sp. Leo170 TaxID=1571199 RepID=UPI00102EC467|nr:hypothetical protein [Bradyrhizobium sp. Leo170]TAI66326.1 hypothetical protein CWO89_08690 [Bradyrhizobium sp. Leo170]